jgi:hypothetical protein
MDSERRFLPETGGDHLTMMSQLANSFIFIVHFLVLYPAQNSHKESF